MDEQDECTCRISKSGRNLMARIPDKHIGKISRGDKVKIIVIEKSATNDKNIENKIDEFLDNPNGEKLKGTIMGYPVVIPIAKIINMNRSKAKKILLEALT